MKTIDQKPFADDEALPDREREALAGEVWRLLAGFAFRRLQGGRHTVILRELGLTPGHMKALAVLDPAEPRPMRAMADALACDASMVTWLVDRLEERGLVERRSSPSDRRVRTIALTPEGVRTRERLARELFEPPDELQQLSLSDLRRLRSTLHRLPSAGSPFWSDPIGAGTGARSETPV